jgi:hypothetical protein
MTHSQEATHTVTLKTELNSPVIRATFIDRDNLCVDFAGLLLFCHFLLYPAKSDFALLVYTPNRVLSSKFVQISLNTGACHPFPVRPNLPS